MLSGTNEGRSEYFPIFGPKKIYLSMLKIICRMSLNFRKGLNYHRKISVRPIFSGVYGKNFWKMRKREEKTEVFSSDPEIGSRLILIEKKNPKTLR